MTLYTLGQEVGLTVEQATFQGTNPAGADAAHSAAPLSVKR